MENFETMGLPSEVIHSLNKMNINNPTEIQRKAIPIALNGADILASSQTGSGKTIAYLLPLICSIMDKDNIGLVLVPTRELALQVNDALFKLRGKLRLPSAVLIGGDSISKQLVKLKAVPKVIIGTPGRVIDHLLRGSLSLNNVSVVVLDEMDRMLDMGLKEQLEQISEYLPKEKQVLMFSATIPKHIVQLSQKYLRNPERIMIGATNKAAVQITQESVKVAEGDKFNELIKQLELRSGSIMVFVKTKRGADQLAKMLRHKDHSAEAIHGDLRQTKREKVIQSFRQNKHRVMVATDVAARGLDIPHTQHVINYDLPMCPEDYLHRIGRTGRAGAAGFALSFISPEDSSKWRAIDRLINFGESEPREYQAKSRKKSGYFSHSRKESSGSYKKPSGNYGKKRYDDEKRSGASGRKSFKSFRAYA
jgi:superfamily II DNA/RNA helicase